jgi:hypothetical protein
MTPALLSAIADFISRTGFPIFVAVVLLWRVDAMHAANLRAINELTIAIVQLRSMIDDCHHENVERK